MLIWLQTYPLVHSNMQNTDCRKTFIMSMKKNIGMKDIIRFEFVTKYRCSKMLLQLISSLLFPENHIIHLKTAIKRREITFQSEQMIRCGGPST